MKSILTLVREVDRGQLLEDLETALGDIANAIEKNGGSGQIALTLKFKKKGDAFLISGDFTHATLKPPRTANAQRLVRLGSQASRRDSASDAGSQGCAAR